MDSLYLRQVLAGDTAKFSYFITQYKDMAFSIAFRIVSNREDAEEVVQDAFMKAFKALASFRYDSKFSTWFYRIVVNTALKRVRKDKQEIADVDISNLPLQVTEHIENAYSSLANEDQKKIIDLAMGKLAMEDRLLLTLFYLNENTVAEINEITGISPENIKMKLLRARKKMYIILEKDLKIKLNTIV